MKKSGEYEDAVSSVIGTVLLVGLTVIMVSVIAVVVFAFEPPQPAPQARITSVEVRGGLPPSASFASNMIKLRHRGGDSLDLRNTKIIIYGSGRSHRDFGEGYVPPPPGVGNVQVIYFNLTKYGKITNYNSKNSQLLQDGLWSAGESLLLSGADSLNANDDISSVRVIVNGDSDNANNYGFKVGENIYINIIDTVTDQIICTASARVKRA